MILLWESQGVSFEFPASVIKQVISQRTLFIKVFLTNEFKFQGKEKDTEKLLSVNNHLIHYRILNCRVNRQKGAKDSQGDKEFLEGFQNFSFLSFRNLFGLFKENYHRKNYGQTK